MSDKDLARRNAPVSVAHASPRSRLPPLIIVVSGYPERATGEGWRIAMLKHAHVTIRVVIVAMFALLLATSASADMVTFWKTNQCPEYNGKLALARQAGTMEAPVVLDPLMADPTPISVGGPFCNLDAVGDTTSAPSKNLRVNNASIFPDNGPVLGAWDCVVCQYPNKVIFIGAGMPAVSLTALAFVGGGLATFGLIRLRRRQTSATAA